MIYLKKMHQQIEQELFISAFLKKVFRSILGRYNHFTCMLEENILAGVIFFYQKGEACYWSNSPGRSFPVGLCLGV